MLKVLLVDDDIFMLTELKSLVNWERLGFQICGEAKNGASGIHLIDECMPHLVITDMSMPVVDGIGLIKHIEQEHPQIKVIALSGYDDFDYVKQSMKRGAVDYILKHKLDAEVLSNAISSAKQSIESIIYENNKKLQEVEQLAIARGLLKQEFIYGLASGRIINKTLIVNSIETLKLDMDLANLVISLIEIDDFSFIEEKYSVDEKDKLIRAFMDISENILSDFGKAVISYLEKGSFIIIFSLGNLYGSLYLQNQMLVTIDRIRSSIKRYLNITACFSVSSIFNDINDIHNQYNKVEGILKNKFYKGKDMVLNENIKEAPKDNFHTLSLKDEKHLTMLTRDCKRHEVSTYIESIFHKLVDCNASYKSIQMVSAELINVVNKISREWQVEISKVYIDKDIPYSKLQKYGTATDIKQWIMSIYDRLISIVEGIKIDANYSENTKKAIVYINANYQKNISLNDVSSYIGVNSSYLSRVFKGDCGKGFNEYLNELRVEKAKLLIEAGSFKLKNIVNEVGFGNYNYFFKVFKDITGLTPLEFEENLRHTS